MATKSTVKIGNINFRRVGCSKSKRSAQTNAKALRNKGFTARVIKSTDKGKTTYCVFQGRKAKPNATQKRRKKR